MSASTECFLFKAKAETTMGKVRRLVDKMPYKGDKCQDSQRMCLILAINNLEYQINGVKPSDFEREDEP